MTGSLLILHMSLLPLCAFFIWSVSEAPDCRLIGVKIDDAESSVTRLTETRRGTDLHPVWRDVLFDTTARSYARLFAGSDHFDQVGHDGSASAIRARGTGHHSWLFVETLALNYTSLLRADEGRRKSPRHYENDLMAGAQHTCVAGVTVSTDCIAPSIAEVMRDHGVAATVTLGPAGQGRTPGSRTVYVMLIGSTK